MIRNKKFKRFWFLGVLLFQCLPIGIIVYFAWGFRNYPESGGWMQDLKNNCKVYTHFNAQNRYFNWDGDCVDGFANGYGQLLVYEGQRPLYRFEGELLNGKMEDKGKFIVFSDGDYYEGGFKNSKIHGFGHYYNDDGDHYEGFYEEGIRTGQGTYWYSPESQKLKYEGQWKENLEHGQGQLIYRNGKIISGQFEKGVLVKELESSVQELNTLPKNILITNDDGVEDLDRLKCLAEEVAQFADRVVIAACKRNRSSTSTVMAMPKQGFIDVKCLSADSSNQIYIYEVDGYPADCVLWAALGFFQSKGENIDLVISGINGGPNIGVEWFGSGTIGAARTAALAGIPAIAVSGIDEDNEPNDNLATICQWVSKVAQSPLIGMIKPFEYLTISIPEKLDKIKGVKIVERAITYNNPPFYLEKGEDQNKIGQNVKWSLKPLDPLNVYDQTANRDVNYYYDNYVVVVPMSVNENNFESLPSYKKYESVLPSIN